MKKLLILTTNYPPSTSIGTQRILRICKYLDAERWKIHVLTLKEKYYPEGGASAGNGALSFLDRVTVWRTEKLDLVFFMLRLRERLRGPGRGTGNGGGNGAVVSEVHKRSAQKLLDGDGRISPWQRFKDIVTDLLQFPDKNMPWLPVAVWRGWRTVRREGIDVIFSSSPPHSLHLMSALIKTLSGCRLVIDYRDPWARSPWHDEERELNGFERWKHNRIIALERWVVRTADVVLLITEQMQRDFRAHYADLPAEKFQLFYNGFDPDNRRAVQAAVAGRAPGGERVTFMHAGSLYRYRDPSPIVQAVQNLIQRGDVDRDRIRLTFIGSINSDQVHVTDMVREMGLDDVVEFIPKVPYSQVWEYMAASDVLMLLQPVTRLQLPGKFYDYLCVDRPILGVAEPDSPTATVVNDRFGLFVNYNEVGDIERGILALYRQPGGFDERIRSNREAFDISSSIQIIDRILMG